MKKKVRFLALLLALLILSACGSSASGAADMDYAAEAAYDDGGWYAEEAEFDGDWYEDAAPEMAAMTAGSGVSAEGVTEGTPATEELSEKIIYSAYAEIETTEFDQSVEAVYNLMDQYGAFMENSTVTGRDINETYSGSRSNRSASFTLRVPKDRYAAMTSALDAVGSVTYLSSSADNITAQYTDTASRLAAYEVEEARLLEILGQAETVEDMITVESRLSEIRYEKEYLTSTLKNWDNQVSYSTVELSLREVKVLTPEPVEEKTYWQQVGEGFLDTLQGMGRACMTIFRVFVALLPVLMVLAVIAVAIVLLARRNRKKKAAARAAKAAEPPISWSKAEPPATETQAAETPAATREDPDGQ